MNMDEFLHYEGNRRDAYKLVSMLYYPPEEETLAKLPALGATVEVVCPEAAACIAAVQHESDIERLKIDYARLFVGPFKLLAPPYGSVYLEDKRTVMGVSTLDATKHYAEAGLLISEQLKEAPDHITVEMEFMYFLVFRELESIGMGDYVQAATYLEKQRTFLTRHMGLWIAEFSDLVHHHAHTSFYQKLAKVTKTLIQTEQSNIVEKSIVQLAKLNGGEKVSCLHDECTSDGEMINK